MSHTNAELLRSKYDAFARGDIRPLHGHGKVLGFFQTLGERSKGRSTSMSTTPRQRQGHGGGLVTENTVQRCAPGLFRPSTSGVSRAARSRASCASPTTTARWTRFGLDTGTNRAHPHRRCSSATTSPPGFQMPLHVHTKIDKDNYVIESAQRSLAHMNATALSQGWQTQARAEVTLSSGRSSSAGCA
jgi:hypothetical protein